MNDAPLGRVGTANIIAEAMNADLGIVYRYTRVVESRSSGVQSLQILDTPAFGRVLRLDGVTMTSEGDEFFYHENLVHVPAVAHLNPRNVAIIGGGDGGALREVLKHRCVERAALVELDPSVVELSSKHLSAINGGAFKDPRVTLHFADGRSWLRGRDEQYDLLILDLTDPIGAARALYTAEFYRMCRERLAPGGVVGLHVQSPVTRPRAFTQIVQTLRSIFSKVRPYLVFVPTYGTWFAMATASMDIDPLADTAEGLTRRVQDRGLTQLRFYNPATHFAGFALPNFVLELLRSKVRLLTDRGPRLDQDPEFSNGAHWADLVRSGTVENALTCQSDL